MKEQEKRLDVKNFLNIELIGFKGWMMRKNALLTDNRNRKILRFLVYESE